MVVPPAIESCGMTFLSDMDPATGLIRGSARQVGRDLSETYQSATPFPHIVIDDFLPAAVLESCLRNFPREAGDSARTFDRDQERYKTQFNPDEMEDTTRGLFYSFNSKPFIQVLENITGIRGLIPDPYFLGAGFHEIGQGGHLSVHTDFNHHKPMNLERRINVLIYLNKNWSDDFGGQLEFWNHDMTERKASILPNFNRCVIFNTTDESFHGNPNPIDHPERVTRKSIALYYYTSTWSNARREQTTQFKVRKGSQDKPDVSVKTRELIADLTPPILARALRKGKRLVVNSAADE